MSENMPSWKHLSSAGSRISNAKDYIIHRDFKSVISRPSGHDVHSTEPQVRPGLGWKAWAEQKIRFGKRGSEDGVVLARDVIHLFPGWAVRRYPSNSAVNQGAPVPFEVEVFVSGFANNQRLHEQASRSQKALLRLAKGFASLPKLSSSIKEAAVDAVLPKTIRLSPSTEELLSKVKLPPRPTEISEDYEIEVLDRHFQRLKDMDHSGSSSPASVSPQASSYDLPSTIPTNEHTATSVSNELSPEVLRRLHKNLESRMQLFWSSALSNRTIRLDLFASCHQTPQTLGSSINDNGYWSGDEQNPEYDDDNKPLASQVVVTAPDGSFQSRFKVNWDHLCQHPTALHIAFGEPIQEHDLIVVASLHPATPIEPSSDQLPEIGDQLRHMHKCKRKTPNRCNPDNTPAIIRIPISHSPIRVISDIDDTVKLSNILSGARVVFHNVFVKDLQDNIIPGMGEWYTSMWKKGVRFHYVSNGPFEVLPILNEFFKISQLPPGSIKLKSYAGRSLFNGLLSAPATRKRAGVLDILESFPNSRFILIGDTGEQDLELYADIARNYPERILGVFIRDADTGDCLDDPTGWKVLGATGTTFGSPEADIPKSKTRFSDVWSMRKNSSKTSLSVSPSKTPNAIDHITSSPFTEEPADSTHGDNNATPNSESANTLRPPYPVHPPRSSSFPRFINRPPEPIAPPTTSALSSSFRSTQTSLSSSSTTSSGSKVVLSEAEKRRLDLQARVYRARTQMPSHVFLRIFKDPTECGEVEELLEREKSGMI